MCYFNWVKLVAVDAEIDWLIYIVLEAFIGAANLAYVNIRISYVYLAIGTHAMHC